MNKLYSTPADGMSIIQADPILLELLESEALDGTKRQRVMPAVVYSAFDQSDAGKVISAFCVRNGIYGLVTEELVQFIREQINGRSAIEIGSGDGVLANALGIRATDNRMQDWPEIREHYEHHGQPLTRYGDNVETIDGMVAVAKYAPQVIVASWLTHRWIETESEIGGNTFAPDELQLLANCEALIFVGNSSVHRKHRLLKKPHLHFEYPWIYSRTWKGKNFVGVWKGGRA